MYLFLSYKEHSIRTEAFDKLRYFPDNIYPSLKMFVLYLIHTK